MQDLCAKAGPTRSHQDHWCATQRTRDQVCIHLPKALLDGDDEQAFGQFYCSGLGIKVIMVDIILPENPVHCILYRSQAIFPLASQEEEWQKTTCQKLTAILLPSARSSADLCAVSLCLPLRLSLVVSLAISISHSGSPLQFLLVLLYEHFHS